MKNLSKFLVFLLIIILLIGLSEIAHYYVEMSYSAMAPSQLEDDSVYVYLKTESTAHNLINITFWFFLLIVVCFGYKKIGK